MKKNPLPRMKFYCLLFMLAACSVMNAQSVEFLNSNNISAAIRLGGNQFSDSTPIGNGTGHFESPKGSGRDAIFTQALWLTGYDSAGNLRCAANRYSEFGNDFFDGPVANTYDSIYDHYYKRVWKVTQAQITHFKTLQFPVNKTQVDSAILYWPGAENNIVQTDYGILISGPLAPFVDVNNNGIYEPLNGDYPAICGDEGIFFVYNDIRSQHTETNGIPFGVEVRGLANSFTDSTTVSLPYEKRAVNNAVFVQYEIVNKSMNRYISFDVAQWVDPDLGCFSNDRVGCDTSRSLMFAYNGTAMDADCGSEHGYGNLPIALGVELLNQPINAFGYFTGQGAAGPAQTDPATPIHYRDFSEGLWADSTPFTVGGTGYNGLNPIRFAFPGDPNVAGQWSEVEAALVPGDRRMYMSADHYNLAAGGSLHFDYAFFTSFDSTSNISAIVDTLKRDADVLHAFYYNRLLPCMNQSTASVHEVNSGAPFSVSIYPNPASNLLNIEAGEMIQTIDLFDVTGRLLFTRAVGANRFVMPVNGLSRGLYLLRISGGGTEVTRKVVVE